MYNNRYFFVALSSVVSSHLSKPDLKYVRENLWQYDDGFKIEKGDFIEFDTANFGYELQHDTIFLNGQPQALIVRTNKYFYHMIVSTLDGKLTGVYSNTDESVGR